LESDKSKHRRNRCRAGGGIEDGGVVQPETLLHFQLKMNNVLKKIASY
jgi:hypothetical protein